MAKDLIRIVVAGVPRSYQQTYPDGTWLTPEQQARIKAISPRIDLVHTSRTEIRDKGAPPAPADILMVESSGRNEYGEELPYDAFEKLVTPQLKWLQACSSGVGHILELGLLAPEVVLTSAGGIHAAALGESVMAAILMWAKRLEQRRLDQDQQVWRELHCMELRGKTLCVIGAGHIGQAIASRAAPFGLRIIGVRRSRLPGNGFHETFATRDLNEAVREADFVVVACPLTDETRSLIGAEAITHMKRGAYLINIARGLILDDEAVLDALRSGHLGGAFLDAFHPEPLPSDHPYWTTPNVTVTPHDSHSSEYIGENMADLFCRNLERWLDGEPLLNLVDRERGY